MPSTITDVFDILSDRHEILLLLVGEPLTQQQITEQTNTSQSTVSRILARLQELSIVSETDNQYELTCLGVLVHQKYESFIAEGEQLYAAESLLREMPAEVPLDPVVFDGAEITVSKPHFPDAAVVPLLGLIREATAIKGAATMVHVGFVETFHDRMAQSDLEAEFTVTDAVAERSLKEYGDRDPTPLQTDRLQMYKTTADLPYSLLLIETPNEVYAVVACSGTGTHGTIINTSEPAREWAQEQYQQFKSEASPWAPLSKSNHLPS